MSKLSFSYKPNLGQTQPMLSALTHVPVYSSFLICLTRLKFSFDSTKPYFHTSSSSHTRPTLSQLRLPYLMKSSRIPLTYLFVYSTQPNLICIQVNPTHLAWTILPFDPLNQTWFSYQLPEPTSIHVKPVPMIDFPVPAQPFSYISSGYAN